MKYKPVSQPNIMKLISLLLFSFIFFSCTDNYFFDFVSLIITIGGIIDYINKSLKWRRFKSSAKEITEARVVDRRIKTTSDRHGHKTYYYYFTYEFEHITDKKACTFEQEVIEDTYNWIKNDTLLTVEYVIDKPRLARRLVGDVKNHSSFKSLSHGVKETPVYPDTPEQKPYPETPVYPDTAEQEP